MPAAPNAPSTHLLIPYAAASDPACQQAMGTLALPHLQRLLTRLQPQPPDQGDDYALSPPHERALARALGLASADTADGTLPWAAWTARVVDRPCAWFTPCHWQVGMEHVTVLPPEGLQLGEAQSRALLDALAPFAAEDGLTLTLETPTRWRAEGEPLRGLACASLDRVAHRRADGWLLPRDGHPQAPLLLRLQNEAQMLFYTHPVNDQRTAQGLTSINGFWISGAGVWHGQGRDAPAPLVPDGLRLAAWRGDWSAWVQAWQELDTGPLAELLRQSEQGQPVQLTLCGERHAQTWTSAPVAAPLWRRALQTLGLGARVPPVATTLSAL